MFLSRESVPRGRREEDRELELWFGWDGKKVIFARIEDYCANCIVIWNITN